MSERDDDPERFVRVPIRADGMTEEELATLAAPALDAIRAASPVGELRILADVRRAKEFYLACLTDEFEFAEEVKRRRLRALAALIADAELIEQMARASLNVDVLAAMFAQRPPFYQWLDGVAESLGAYGSELLAAAKPHPHTKRSTREVALWNGLHKHAVKAVTSGRLTRAELASGLGIEPRVVRTLTEGAGREPRRN